MTNALPIPWKLQEEPARLIVAHPDNHVMGRSLPKYVASKIHPDIDDPTLSYSRISVTGTYDRHRPFRISPAEKNKTFNYERPTTRLVEPETLQVSCMPGRDYMFHYASLIATHLSLTGRNPDMVDLEYPKAEACYELFARSNLRAMGTVHTVIIGYVAQICGEQAEWETGGSQQQEGQSPLFGWHRRTNLKGHTICYLGCTTTIWGDIAGQLALALRDINQAQHVLYVGKGGSLWPSDAPNQVLGSGNTSILGDSITWPTSLYDAGQSVLGADAIHRGLQINVRSPLVEDLQWFQRSRVEARWVDCEVGYLARACTSSKMSFDYCMLISDNLAVESDANLTTERQLVHLVPRQKLFQALRRLIDAVLKQPLEVVFD